MTWRFLKKKEKTKESDNRLGPNTFHVHCFIWSLWNVHMYSWILEFTKENGGASC